MNSGALGQDPNQFREMWSHPTWRQKDGEDPRIPWEVGVGGCWFHVRVRPASECRQLYLLPPFWAGHTDSHLPLSVDFPLLFFLPFSCLVCFGKTMVKRGRTKSVSSLPFSSLKIVTNSQIAFPGLQKQSCFGAE